MGAVVSTVIVPLAEEVPLADGHEFLRLRVSDRLGISLGEFFDRVDAGEYDTTEDASILRLVMAVPFAR